MNGSKVYSVLLVEDDEIDRILVRTLLNSRAPRQFELVEASELPKGLEQLRHRKFDLVLLDHTMPELTSIQEVRLVLAEQKTAKVVLHTAYIAPAAAAEALRLGVGQVVEKGELDPLWSAIERSLEHLDGTPAAPESSSVAGGRTVLVVEDEPAVRRILRMSLEFANYTVHEASDGDQALELMHRQGRGVNLVIADLMMPGTGGSKLSAALQRIRSELPVLFISGADVGELMRALGRMPSDDEVLWKPFTPDQLVQRVSKLLKTAA